MERKDCPVERPLDVIGGKWTVLLLHELQGGTRRFGELRAALPGISPKTLTERLRALEEQRIVERTIHPEIPPRVEYALTERGRTLGGIPTRCWNGACAGPDASRAVGQWRVTSQGERLPTTDDRRPTTRPPAGRSSPP